MSAIYPVGVPVPGSVLTLGLAEGGVAWARESVLAEGFRARIESELEGHSQAAGVLARCDRFIRREAWREQ